MDDISILSISVRMTDSLYTVRTNAQKNSAQWARPTSLMGQSSSISPNARGALLEAMVFSIVAGDS